MKDIHVIELTNTRADKEQLTDEEILQTRLLENEIGTILCYYHLPLSIKRELFHEFVYVLNLINFE